MLTLMLGMAGMGLALLGGGAVLTRQRRRRGSDPVAVARVLQALGAALLVGALLVRPYNPDTAAFPPPPDQLEEVSEGKRLWREAE